MQNLKTQIALEIALEKNLEASDAFVQTWSNFRNKKGFKLTGFGFFELKQKYKFWSIPIKSIKLRSIDLLKMERVISSPWFLDHRGLHCFDQSIVVQLMLYNNDLTFWLEAQTA